LYLRLVSDGSFPMGKGEIVQEKLIINGGKPLNGRIRVSGAKNSALKLMAASLMTGEPCRISNVPDIGDVRVMMEVLRHLGAQVDYSHGCVNLQCGELATWQTPYSLVRKMRASIIVMGPLLARYGRAEVAMPGGCNIGSRKIDLHLKGLAEMGVDISLHHGYIDARAERLKGAHIVLDFPSVGATENLMMAAAGAEGITRIDNAAREPEIQDLAGFLISMGAEIEGAGTPSVQIVGKRNLCGTDYQVIGDRIEAGTLAIAAAVTKGEVEIDGIDPSYLQIFLEKLQEIGVEVEEREQSFLVRSREHYSASHVATLPYPGFPTDLQPQIMVLLSLAEGTSVVTENVFESRFMFVDELNRMGCRITIDGHHAVVRGGVRMTGTEVYATDLRAGAALVLAGLAAEGGTVVGDIHHIDRGYERLERKLSALGADIKRETDGEG
jgi:UDP-N-acetylglucosamine 1-carboxyvinyltransferase